MKKIYSLFFVFGLLLAVNSSDAFALSCKTSQSNQSDECWTDVKVSALETVPVVAGVLLKYDINTSDDDRGAYEVRVASASVDYGRIAGVAQRTIATGDRGQILVRGQGKLRSVSAVASGDYLFASSTAGSAGSTAANTGSQDVGFALSAGSAASTIDAYITVI